MQTDFKDDGSRENFKRSMIRNVKLIRELN